MRVLFASSAGAGHIGPVAALARRFVDLGHDVVVVTTRGASSPELHDLDVRYAAGPDPSAAQRFWAEVAPLARAAASPRVEREWFGGLCLEAMLTAMTQTLREWRPELVVRETCEYASAVVAQRQGVRHVQIGVSTARAEASVLRGLVADILDDYHPGLCDAIFESPYLTHFPSSLDPDVYPTTLRYRRPAGTTTSPLDVRDWLREGDRPLVYLTLGTVVPTFDGGLALLNRLVDALSRLDIRLVVTTVVSESGVIGEFGAHVHLASWLPQDTVVARAAVVVCHAGSGTMLGALGAGVPLVMLPVFADQPTNANLVAAGGAGIAIGDGRGSAPENLAELTQRVDRVVDAVREVLVTPRYRDGAREIAAQIHGALDVDDLVALLTGP